MLPNSAAGAKYEWIDHPFELSNAQAQSENYMASLADLCRQEGIEVQIGG